MDEQQEQQQQQQQEANPGSPRRRKPPLDLDAALYLQSQASYVQKPNSPVPATKNNGTISALTAGRLSVHQQQLQQQVLTQAHDGRLSKAFISGDSNSSNKRNQHHHNQQYYYNNISVDYIDCVSNNDLQQQQQQVAIRSTMKGIPHCRKHLRFHRNRVEPFASTGGAVQRLQQQQSQQHSQQQQDDPTSRRASLAIHANSLTASPSTYVTTAAIASSVEENLLGGPGHQQSALLNSNGAEGGAKDEDVETQPTAANSSVLYPIPVDEVKKRTYFIGSLSQDSLLGHDELYRYFPNAKVSIFVCTWNQNRKRAPMNLNDLLLPDQLIYMPDIYAVGIQEAFSSQNDYIREWEIELQTTLGPNHVLLHSCSLGVLHLALFVRRDLIWFCSTPEESVYNSRSMPTNMIKTKGAVSIAFRFFGTSFMFTNCHFPAHEHRLKDRVDEYQRIISSIDLPKNLKLLKPRYLSNDSTARFDCVFFMGDLNFRLEQRTFDETIHIIEDIFQQREPSYEALTQNDELLKVMETNQAFHGFDENPIKFPPTYKFLAQTNKYDRRTKRVPSYTDRILFRSKRQRHIQCLIYDWLPQLLSSDHKPVYCLFDVLVRPGREQNMVASLNAGLFQRAIYLEALKRRAEDPESMRDNGASGSLICSIS